MERTKYLLIALAVSLSSLLWSQNNRTIYQAYITGNMGKWKHAMDSMEALPRKTNNEMLELINYQYGYIAWCISKKHPEQADKYLAIAESNLDLLEKRKFAPSMLYAYKAAFAGFEIGRSPYKAPLIGPQSIHYAQTAVKTDSTNAIAHLQLGNIAYYAPRIFGGSKTEALKHYSKALYLMEKSSASKICNWNYLNLLVVMIDAHINLKQYQKAKNYCIKALTAEPKFNWIKYNRYPLVLKKISENE